MKKRPLSTPAQYEANQANPLGLDNSRTKKPAAPRPAVVLTRAEERAAFLESRPT